LRSHNTLRLAGSLAKRKGKEVRAFLGRQASANAPIESAMIRSSALADITGAEPSARNAQAIVPSRTAATVI